jgi:uncharacterized DUF497 family protein
MMKITFDPAKDAINLKKHGYSLEDAEQLDWEEALSWPDERVDYGEKRIVALAPMGERLFYVAFVDRGLTRRVISLRKANKRELKIYAKNY